MSEFVFLWNRRQRGWPWPSSTLGMDPMFGEDGWCHACGVPRGEQTGSLVLQRKKLRIGGAWAPYWKWDVICVETSLAEEIAGEFAVEFREVRWPDGSPSGAQQLLFPVTGDAWFDPAALSESLAKQHRGRDGARCAECGVWRWLPPDVGWVAPGVDVSQFAGFDVVATPEWFGDGRTGYREVLVRRGLAELIQRASPRDFRIEELDEPRGMPGSEPPVAGKGEPVPAGLVSIFHAQFDDVAAPLAVGVRPSARALHKAAQMRALLQQSKGFVSAEALVPMAQTFFEAGEDDHAFRLWRQAADHGSAIAQRELDDSGRDARGSE